MTHSTPFDGHFS